MVAAVCIERRQSWEGKVEQRSMIDLDKSFARRRKT
jgi:hypothetical protein